MFFSIKYVVLTNCAGFINLTCPAPVASSPLLELQSSDLNGPQACVIHTAGISNVVTAFVAMVIVKRTWLGLMWVQKLLGLDLGDDRNFG